MPPRLTGEPLAGDKRAEAIERALKYWHMDWSYGAIGRMIGCSRETARRLVREGGREAKDRIGPDSEE